MKMLSHHDLFQIHGGCNESDVNHYKALSIIGFAGLFGCITGGLGGIAAIYGSGIATAHPIALGLIGCAAGTGAGSAMGGLYAVSTLLF